MQRYFVKENLKDKKSLVVSKEDLHHIKKVMRGKNGDRIICIDSTGVNYQCVIRDVESGSIIVEEEIVCDNELDVDVTLIYALPKGDKFDLVLQKATELGVKRIVPLVSKRCVVKTNSERFSKKIPRYNKIVKEASEQSYRNYIPEITNLISIHDISMYLGKHNVVAYEETSKEGQHGHLGSVLKQLQAGDSITIVVGCEGGFERQEIEYLQTLHVESCSLGKRILRSETAPLYILSAIGYVREIGG